MDVLAEIFFFKIKMIEIKISCCWFLATRYIPRMELLTVSGGAPVLNFTKVPDSLMVNGRVAAY